MNIYSTDLEDLWEGTGDVTVTCRADCNPRCDRYQIYHDGRVLSYTNVTSITKDRKSSGKYSCGAYDIKSRRYVRSAEVDIDIKYGPSNVKLNSSSDLTDLWEGTGDVTVTCRADCNPRCDRYRIYHDERVLSYTNVTSITKDRKSSGKYSCGAYDIKSRRYVRSAEVDIDIKYGPSNVKLNSSSDLTDLWEGRGYVTVTCRADCNPRCDRYQIYHDGRVLSYTNVTSITKDRKSSGKYSCGAYDIKSRRYVRSAEVDIDIKYGPSNAVMYSSSDLDDLWEGREYVNLTCRADCNPRCDRYQITGPYLSHTNEISIKKDRKNSGKYKCWAYDVKLTRYVRSAEVDIDIKSKESRARTHDTDVGIDLSSNNSETTSTEKEYRPRNVSIYSLSDLDDLWEGRGYVTLTCRADCNPRCDKYQIYHEGQVISNAGVTSMEQDRKHSGIYSCGAYDVKSGEYVRSAKVDIDIKLLQIVPDFLKPSEVFNAVLEALPTRPFVETFIVDVEFGMKFHWCQAMETYPSNFMKREATHRYLKQLMALPFLPNIPVTFQTLKERDNTAPLQSLTVNKDGMVYVEIDFNDMPSTGKSIIQGAENRTQYVDIDLIKNLDSKSDDEKNQTSKQNGKE
ncbi:uncharacterized protein LOC134281130 [Saccostrea cucullata]|uniref:uncharacterized protein LOC134281130 n=1 Tax=Saccostrea cuccullata TaxID=36930 RepID=UPI002ED3A0F3